MVCLISTRLDESRIMGAGVLIEQLHFSALMGENSPNFAQQWEHSMVFQPEFSTTNGRGDGGVAN